MRAAASSRASGSPSRRAQIAAIAAALSVVGSKAGLTARALDTNSSTAGERIERVDVRRSIGRRKGQGVHRHDAFGDQAEWLAARDEQRHPGRVAEQVGQIACRVEHLLEVVEHEQDALLAEIAEQRLASGFVDPQRLRRSRYDERRIEDRSQRHEEDTGGERLDQLGRDLEREARLSRSSRSRQRDDACIGLTDELTQLLDLSLAAEERRRLGGKVRRPVVERSKWRELGGQAVDDELVETLRLAEILEAMEAEVREREARPAAVEELARRLRDEHLAAVGRRADPCAAVDAEADVPAVARVDRARVEAHPDAQRPPVRPGVPLESVLSLDGRQMQRPPDGQRRRRTSLPVCRPRTPRVGRTPLGAGVGARRARRRTPARAPGAARSILRCR